MIRAGALGPLILLTFLSGCQQALPLQLPSYIAAADDAYAALGHAPDGKGVFQFNDGLVIVDVEENGNVGRVEAVGRLNANHWHLNFSSFAGLQATQDGGIATNLILGGGEGLGDTCWPAAAAEMAAWGTADVLVDGKVFPDAIGGSDNWSAHVSVLREGVRHDAKRHLGSAPAASCSESAKGQALRGDAEIHLQLRNRTGVFRPVPLLKETAGLPVVHPFYYEQYSFRTKDANAVVRARLNVTAPATLVGTSLVIEVRPEFAYGGVVRRWTVADVVSDQVRFEDEFVLDRPGEYAVLFMGRAAGVTYEVTLEQVGRVSLYNFWFENVAWGDDALRLGRALFDPDSLRARSIEEEWYDELASGDDSEAPRLT